MRQFSTAVGEIERKRSEQEAKLRVSMVKVAKDRGNLASTLNRSISSHERGSVL